MTALLPNVPLYPEHDAQTVKRFAHMVFYEPAIEAVDLVKQMLGHPGNVQRSVRAWEAATSKMSNSLNHVSTGHSEVTSHWDGAAFRAFNVYVTDTKARINTNIAQLQAISTSTINLYLGVMENYKIAITFITKCASILLRFGGGLFDDFKELFGLATAPEGGLVLLMGHITKSLADMTDNINNVMSDVISTSAKYNSAMQDAQSHLSAIKALPNPGGDVDRLDSWTAK